jgi:hypothetical protein
MQFRIEAVEKKGHFYAEEGPKSRSAQDGRV